GREVKVRELIKRAEQAGWVMQKRTGTNHRKFKHPTKDGTVIISGNPGDDVATGTLHSTLQVIDGKS
ncbi:MAG TPA: type II toxin-antitoxin system HicA family toxin, partial [Chloroflexota bacterium]|nr:type II toxin-antitoxin system HicA family toxin [Chloroflexota bacterium]